MFWAKIENVCGGGRAQKKKKIKCELNPNKQVQQIIPLKWTGTNLQFCF